MAEVKTKLSVYAKYEDALCRIRELEAELAAAKRDSERLKVALRNMLNSTAYHSSYCESIPGFNDKKCNCALGKAPKEAVAAMSQEGQNQ